MADLTFPTSAIPGRGAYLINGYANVALAQGQMVYKTANRKMGLVDAVSATSAVGAGMVVGSASIDAPIRIQATGQVIGLTGLTPGVVYYFSDAVPGGLCLYADIAQGSRVVIAGYATSATAFQILIRDTGYTVP